MRLLRPVLTLLLVFGLAATPVAARVAVKSTSPDAAQSGKSATMPDCHGMKIPTTADKAKSVQKTCPGCDANNSCSADGCGLQCVKNVAALPVVTGEATKPLQRFSREPQDAVVAFARAPPAPPPRT